MSNYKDRILDCYIFFYHTQDWFILPQYPESITDSISSTFAQQNALGRTAPIFSYSHSGPRTLTVDLVLHRDMLNDLNRFNLSLSDKKLNDIKENLNIEKSISVSQLTDSKELPFDFSTDDYVDLLIKKLQSVALPEYNTTNKEIDPPRVALRFGDEIFIKGVVDGGIRVTYNLPLVEYNGLHKYASVNLSFTISESDPIDAQTVNKYGSFRAITTPKDLRR